VSNQPFVYTVRMQLKKKYLSVVIIAGLVLAGCQQQPPTTTTENVTLQWWGTVHSEAVMQPLIDEYQALNNNVKIDYSTARWNKSATTTVAAEQYRQELNSKLTSNNINTIPDIFSIDSTWVGMYEKYISAAPSDVYNATIFRNTFWPVASANFLVRDTGGEEKVLGFPDYIDVLGLAYNNGMLAAEDPSLRIPTSWNDFRTLARRLTKRGAGSAITQAGFAGGTGKNVEFAPQVLNLLMQLNGSSMTDLTGKPIFATDDNLASSTAAMDFYHSFATNADKTWVDDTAFYRNDSSAFLEQKVASIIVPSWRYRQLLKFNEQSDLNIDIKVAKTPQLAGGDSDRYWATYFGNVVSNQRPKPAEAWKFLSWLSQPAQLKKLSENTEKELGYFGLLSPRVDMQGDQASNQYLSVYNEMLAGAQSWYMVDGFQVNRILRDSIDKGASEGALRSAETQIQSLVANKNNLISAGQ
jgi:ABC-type glycerol-3-phosphate transport system substrate-binding protein